METVKVKVTKVNYSDKDKAGNPLVGQYGPYFKVGLLTDRFGDTWINGLMKTNCKDWEGTEREIIVFDEEYNGKTYKKFKVASEKAKQEAKVGNLESRVAALEEAVKKLQNVTPDF